MLSSHAISLRWRKWSTRRLLLIHFSAFSLFLRLLRKRCSPLIIAMGDSVGAQVAFRPGVNTDNVADLMVGKLNRLPLQSQKALQRLACLANRAEISTLSIVHGT